KTDGFKLGTFELYENDSLVGLIYRSGNYQLESVPGNTELVARIDYVTDSTYLLRVIEEIQVGVDSLIWLNKYKKISENKYKIIATPVNSDIDYEYKGVLLKVTSKIDQKFLDKLVLLNE